MAKDWHPTWDDDLRAAWADGTTVEIIAAHTGCSIGAVSLRVQQLELPDRDPDGRLLDRRAGWNAAPRLAPLVGAAALIEAEAVLAVHRGARFGERM